MPGFARIFVRWCFCNIFSAVSPCFTSDVASEGGILASPAAQETLPLAWSWQLPKWGEDRESGKQNDLFRDQFAWRIIGISRMHVPYLAMFSLCHRCLKYPRKLNIMISIWHYIMWKLSLLLYGHNLTACQWGLWPYSWTSQGEILRSLITGRVVTSPGWMELAALHQRLAVGPTQMCQICHLQRHGRLGGLGILGCFGHDDYVWLCHIH